MDQQYTDSEGRRFSFRRETATEWRVFVTPASGGMEFAAGAMPVIKDWQGREITSPVTLYRLGAGRHLYGMTVADEISLSHHHLDFLRSTKRHAKRIAKAEARLEWLHRIAAAGHAYMAPEWEQGAVG